MMMNEKNYHKYLALTIILLLSLLTIIIFSITNNYERVDLLFSEEAINQANELFTNTPQDTEFFAYLKVSNNTVNNVSLMGYKNLLNEKVRIVNHEVLPTIYTLHNHDNGVCLPSEEDLELACDVACIICKENDIACYKTKQGGLNNE